MKNDNYDVIDNLLSINSIRPTLTIDTFCVNEINSLAKYANGSPDKEFDFHKNVIGKDIPYFKYEKTTYQVLCYMKDMKHDIPVLHVNLPYEYYSVQKIPEGIIMWDENKKQYKFRYYVNRDILNIFDMVSAKGIPYPLLMQISNGQIVSASYGTYIMLLIAIYLKIPSLPVSLYILDDEDYTTSKQVRSGCYVEETGCSQNMYNMINKLCNPYFKFYNRKFDDISSDILDMINYTTVIGEGDNNTFIYVPSKDITPENIDDIEKIHLYRKPVFVNNIQDESVESIHEELLRAENEKLTNEVDTLIEQYS